GTVGLPNSQYRTVDCFWPGVGSLGQGEGFRVGVFGVFVELAFVWIVFEPHAPHPGTLSSRRRRRDAAILKPSAGRGVGAGGTCREGAGLHDHGSSRGLRFGSQHRRSYDRLPELALEFLPAGSHRPMRYLADSGELETPTRGVAASVR